MEINWSKEIGDFDTLGEWLKDVAQEFSDRKMNIKSAAVIIVMQEHDNQEVEKSGSYKFESMLMRSNYGESPMALLTALSLAEELLRKEQIDSFSSESGDE